MAVNLEDLRKENSGIKSELKEEIKEHGNIINGITIPLIIP